MKASKGTIARAVDNPNRDVRLYLFHGPDEAQSRALAARLMEALGATKFVLNAATIKADPAALADEAGAMSLFGGQRLIWVEPAGKEIEDGVAALLDGPATECPVVAIAGALTKASTLLRLAEGSPLAVAFAAYAPEGLDAQRMVIDVGRRFGLKISARIAARLADSADNDQAIVSRELEKLALYIDAAPNFPKELDDDAIDAVGADCGEGNSQRVADIALTGDVESLCDELGKLPAAGNDGIPIVRSLQRRLLMLAPARARIERGERLDAVMASLGKTLFWKDKGPVQQMLQKWSAADLATAAERASKLERALIFTAVPGMEALGEELFSIARKARSH